MRLCSRELGLVSRCYWLGLSGFLLLGKRYIDLTNRTCYEVVFLWR